MNFLPDFPLAFSPLFYFGILLVLGSIGGFIAHKVSWLPSITGFILVGFTFGPSGLHIISAETLASMRIIIDVSLGFILYRLGLALDVKALLQEPRLLVISVSESLATFLAVFLVLGFFNIPAVLAALVAAIVISSSPAVLLHVAAEVGAKGKVTDNAKSLVALNNFFAFIAFTIVLPAMHASVDAGWATILLQPLYRLLGSLLVGIGIAYGLKTMVNATASASQYQLALVIGAIVLTLGISQSLKLSLLFAPLILGITIRSIENRNLLSELELGATFELFFIVLFVFAGANLHIAEVFEFAPVIFSIVLVRCCAKLGVSTLLSASRLPGAAIGQQKMRQGFATGILLIPMAGLAIGLTQTTSLLFPVYASTLSAIVLGAVAVFETIGPPLAAYAFRLAGETGKIPSAHQHSQHGAETPGTE